MTLFYFTFHKSSRSLLSLQYLPPVPKLVLLHSSLLFHLCIYSRWVCTVPDFKSLLEIIRKYQENSEAEWISEMSVSFIYSLFCLGLAVISHSSTLAWKIPWTEEPGRLQSMGSLRGGHDWATSLSLFIFMHWRRKWQPTPVFLPGESQGWGSLVGFRLWGRRVRHDWRDLAAVAAAAVITHQGFVLSLEDQKKTKEALKVLIFRGFRIERIYKSAFSIQSDLGRKRRFDQKYFLIKINEF